MTQKQSLVGAGRYAPSPSGDLHLGNLRTALLAWLWARSTGRAFFLRVEDLDRDRSRDPSQQLQDLQAMGIDWDGPVIIQSERTSLYEEALETLRDQDLVFECFCSRKDIQEAVNAVHGTLGSYPGTCLNLTEQERDAKRTELAKNGRRPAMRLKPQMSWYTITDELHGRYTGPVEAVVLRRGDGQFAYNLAVVVDDIAMGVDQVVRGDDLLSSAPTQAYLTHVLGGEVPTYAHVPLIYGQSGKRLAKRDGSVTVSQLSSKGYTVAQIVEALAASSGLGDGQTASDLLECFQTQTLQTAPTTYFPELGLSTN